MFSSYFDPEADEVQVEALEPRFCREAGSVWGRHHLFELLGIRGHSTLTSLWDWEMSDA